MSSYTPQAPAPSGGTEGAKLQDPSTKVQNGSTRIQEEKFRKWLETGGVFAAVVLIAFGGGSIVMSMQGRGVVKHELLQQKIVGASDMTPKAAASEAKAAGLSKSITLPTCTGAGKTVDNGATARCFASYMRIHALVSTGGLVYSQIPQYATANGEGTNSTEKALIVHEQPVENPARATWVTETALSTALNASYMAEQLGLFGVVVGVALLLAGAGFGILALGGALRAPATGLPKFVLKRFTGAPQAVDDEPGA
jgi:hypothetical protein